MLSLLVIVYHYTASDTQYQIYIPVFLLFVFLVTPKLSNWLQYRYNANGLCCTNLSVKAFLAI